MAQKKEAKKKIKVKVSDLKPKKDPKGGWDPRRSRGPA
jgi:hypothetical protein